MNRNERGEEQGKPDEPEKITKTRNGSDASYDVARQLRAVRKSQGMTQESLAELVGTKKSNISRLESGRYNPSLEFLVKVAGGLGKQIQVKVK